MPIGAIYGVTYLLGARVRGSRYPVASFFIFVAGAYTYPNYYTLPVAPVLDFLPGP